MSDGYSGNFFDDGIPMLIDKTGVIPQDRSGWYNYYDQQGNQQAPRASGDQEQQNAYLNDTGKATIASIFGPNPSWQMTPNGGNTANISVTDSNGNNTYNQNLAGDNPGFMDAFMAQAVPAMVGGAFTGGLGFDSMFAGDPWTKALAKGATSGAMSAGMQGGNIAQGALQGGIGGGISNFNPASSFGVSNPVGASAINSAFGSGAGALASGRNVGQSALTGGLTGGLTSGLSQGIKMLGDNYNSPFNNGASASSDLMGMGGLFGTQQSQGQQMPTFGGADGSSFDAPSMYFNQTESPATFGDNPFGGFSDMGNASAGGGSNMAQGNSWFDSDVGKKFRDLLHGAGSFVGSHPDAMAKTLLGLFQYHQNNKGLNSQIGGLQGLYGPNSPYAQQMRQQLDRRDAASGRRSQYGPREVELQAALANAASRNAPTLAGLYQQQNQNRGQLVNSMYQRFKDFGGPAALGKIFQPQQGGTMQSQPQQMPAMGQNPYEQQYTPQDPYNIGG